MTVLVEGNGDGIPAMPWRHTGGAEVWFQSFLTPALYVGEWITWCPCCFTPRLKTPGYPLNRGLGGTQSKFGNRGEEKNIFPLLKIRSFFSLNIIWMGQYTLFWSSLMPCRLIKLQHFFHEIKSPSSGTLLKGVSILFSWTYGPMASKTSFLDRPEHQFSNFSLSF